MLVVAVLALLSFNASGIRLSNTLDESVDAPKTCTADTCKEFLNKIMLGQDFKGRKLAGITCETGSPECSLAWMPNSDDQFYSPAAGELNFLEIAKKAGTDKVTAHNYAPMYQKWLGKYSKGDSARFTFVENGFSRGHSARAWHEFLPRADIHELEVACGQEWNHDETDAAGTSTHHRSLGYCTLHCGDGTEAEFLDISLRTNTVGKPLIAVDDGRHEHKEMHKFFDAMFPRLQIGGLLFIEDLSAAMTFVEDHVEVVMKELMDGKPSSVALMECHQDICVFQKGEEK